MQPGLMKSVSRAGVKFWNATNEQACQRRPIELNNIVGILLIMVSRTSRSRALLFHQGRGTPARELRYHGPRALPPS